MSNALFLDVSNLNALFKVSGKFCFAASYASCPERLVLDAQALGASFDVYLSMWPRYPGEGDVELRHLDLASVPFIALKEEVEGVLKYVQEIPGVSEIYFCNALANFVVPARVENFSAVLCAGSRYAYVTVKDRQVTECKFYATPKEFYDEHGEAYSCYGDTDLVDVDSIRAQYPELSEVQRSILVPITPLVVSYRSQYRSTAAEVIEDMSIPIGQPMEEEPEEEVQVVRQPIPTSTGAYVAPQKPKAHIDWVAAILAVFFCAGCALNGFCYNMRNAQQSARGYELERKSISENAVGYLDIAEVYNNSNQLLKRTADLLEYSKASDLGVSVSDMNVVLNEATISFNCTSRDTRDAYREYLSTRYEVTAVNEYSSTTNSDGTTTYMFGAVVVLPDPTTPEG